MKLKNKNLPFWAPVCLSLAVLFFGALLFLWETTLAFGYTQKSRFILLFLLLIICASAMGIVFLAFSKSAEIKLSNIRGILLRFQLPLFFGFLYFLLICWSLATVLHPLSRALPIVKLISLLATTLFYLTISSAYSEAARNIERAKQLAYWLRVTAISFTPLLVASLLVAVLYGRTIFDHVPYIKDEMFYWLQARTFSTVGFGGGYYTAYEMPATASFTHFGNHGFIFPLVYGGLGILLGWHGYSIVFLNYLILSAGIFIFLLQTKSKQADLKLLAILFTVFTPIIVSGGTSLSEGFHISISVFLAALFAGFDSQRQPQRRRVLVAAAAVFLCGLARPTWAILFIPVAYFALPQYSQRWRLLLSLAVGSVAFFLTYKAWGITASPYPHALLFSESSKALGAIASYANIIATFVSNIAILRDYSPLTMPGATIWGSVFLIFYLLFYTLYHCVVKRNTKVWRNDSGEIKVLLFIVLSGTLLFLLALVPFQHRGERYMGGFFLFSVLMLLLSGRQKLIWLLVIGQLLALPGTIQNYYKDNLRNYTYLSSSVPKEFEEFAEVAETFLVFNRGANPWCNTLVSENLPPTYMAIPAGIGVSIKFEDLHVERYSLPLKSKYIILDRPIPGQNWLLLENTPYGGLYLNQDSECFLSQQ